MQERERDEKEDKEDVEHRMRINQNLNFSRALKRVEEMKEFLKKNERISSERLDSGNPGNERENDREKTAFFGVVKSGKRGFREFFPIPGADVCLA